MSPSRYPQYAPSGADWLGEVPQHWTLCRSDKVLASQITTVQPEELHGKTVFHYSIPVVQEHGTGRVEDGSKIESSKLLITSAQVLVSKLNPRKGTTCIAQPHEELTVCSGEFVPLAPQGVDLHFTYYAVSSEPFRQRLEGRVEAATKSHQRVLPSDIAKFPWALPPLAEQAAIAAFLDRETGKIDALVEEQRRLIELLKEKRQAVISHAVTKGLDPNAKMKPSGVEWLGDVPEHWEVLPLKRCLSSVDYGISDSLEPEGTVAVLRMGNIQDGKVDVDDLKYVDEVDPSLLLRTDDLLYNRTNSLDLIGKVGHFEERDGPTTFASYLVRLRTSPGSDPRFLGYLLNTDGILGTARSRAFVAIGQCNLNPTRYGEVIVVRPPLAEQQALVGWLQEETKAIDALVGEALQAVALLQERRAALISAAVTGKIDVREVSTGARAA